jgi:hypothetical protein
MKPSKNDFARALCQMFSNFGCIGFDVATERLFWAQGVPEDWEKAQPLVERIILEAHVAGSSMIVSGDIRVDPFLPEPGALAKEVTRVRVTAIARMAETERQYNERLKA